MFDLFGIRARKEALKKEQEAKRLAEVQAAKKKYQERKELISSYLSKYYIEKKAREDNELRKLEDEAKIDNTICPKCHSNNVVNHIKRGKGKIHGEGNYHSSFNGTVSLFTNTISSSSHGHSKIDGKYDTYPINKCNDCGHEWNIVTVEKPEELDIFNGNSSFGPDYLYNRINEYLNMTYDPYDIKETCNSLEEKREDFFKRVNNSWMLKEYRKLPRYMIDYLIYEGMSQRYYLLEEDNKQLGYTTDKDHYSYEMPDEIWEIVKKILNWEGEDNVK